MNILGGSGGMFFRENLKFRSSKTAGNAPKTRILLILSLSMGMHPYSGINKSYSTGCTWPKLALHARDLVEFCHTLRRVLANFVLFFFLMALVSCLVSLAAVFWMSRNAPTKERLLGRCVTSKGEGGRLVSCHEMGFYNNE